MQMTTRGHERPIYRDVKLNRQSLRHLFITEEASLDLLKPLFEACKRYYKQSLVITDLDISPIKTNSYQLIPRAKSAQFVASLVKGQLTRTTIYIAGTEGFMWDIQNLVLKSGIDKESIRMFEPISDTRRVICTHCFTVMDNINHRTTQCTGCQRMLEVQNKFSELHAAYSGVQLKFDPKQSPLVRPRPSSKLF
ncbi:dimethylamine monooxygenase subunit DmmA family protein [Leucothrix arctica]|uniref:Dimethylamine monooxygenase subunit DmmA-like C-terminal domain-containing protein n=1 Tax=Leucothrix arctica TaxID=1481894 RepID=A0A317C6J9_9GAMM|nr:dimethylamine monooxygenase subunit DmmA family protein [Leucothrix arctica]PWQ94228.1 hypothetical protein DKT75_16980 [Leucothrix arctica]